MYTEGMSFGRRVCGSRILIILFFSPSVNFANFVSLCVTNLERFSWSSRESIREGTQLVSSVQSA